MHQQPQFLPRDLLPGRPLNLQPNPVALRRIVSDQPRAIFSTRAAPDIRLIVLRHAERVDQAQGKEWYKKIFGTGPTARAEAYQNPLLAHHVPRRDMTLLYEFDPPLSRNGEECSTRKGQQLAQNGINVDYCYSSPASRCVLTASAILKGMRQNDVDICIEPLLFEPLNWNQHLRQIADKDPFLGTHDWRKSGHRVDQRYRPRLPHLDLYTDEQDYLHRSQSFFDSIVRKYDSFPQNTGLAIGPRKPTTILVVAHASTPGMFTTITTHKTFNPIQLKEEANKSGYLHSVILDRDSATKKWSVHPQSS